MTTQSEHVNDTTLASLAAATVEDLSVDAHLRQCTVCQARAAAWQRLADATEAWVNTVDPPGPEVLADLLRQLDQAETVGSPAPVTTLQGGRRHRGRWWTIGVAAAAAVVVMLVVLLIPSGSGPSGTDEAAALALIHAAPSAAAASAVSSQEQQSFVERAQQGYKLESIASKIDLGFSTGAYRQLYRWIYPPVPLYWHTSVLSDGRYVYLPTYGTPSEKRWVAYPASGPFPARWQQPLGFLRFVKGPVKDLGSRTIDGTAVSGYAVTVPTSVLVAWQAPAFRGFTKADYAGVKIATVRLWLNSNGRPVEIQTLYRQLQPHINGPVLVTITQRLTYSQMPFRVTPPAVNQTAFVSNYRAAFALQLQDERDEEACAPTASC